MGVGLSYILFKRGVLATNGIYAGIFARSDPALDRPDIQINTNIWTVASRTKSGMKPHPFPGFTMSPVHLAPRNEGTVRLRSPNPLADPEIRQNFFKDRADIRAMVSAVRLVRTVAEQEALKPFIAGEISPGQETQSDEQIEAYLRANGIANLHPVGSCRMGPAGDNVVDPQLRVHGCERLRVVDTSIMPTLPAGNTNAPAIMIGEKASVMILQAAR
jgi:choline dehydrogenase